MTGEIDDIVRLVASKGTTDVSARARCAAPWNERVSREVR